MGTVWNCPWLALRNRRDPEGMLGSAIGLQLVSNHSQPWPHHGISHLQIG